MPSSMRHAGEGRAPDHVGPDSASFLGTGNLTMAITMHVVSNCTLRSCDRQFSNDVVFPSSTHR